MEYKDLVYVQEVKRKVQSMSETKEVEKYLNEAIKWLQEKGYSDQEIQDAFAQKVILEAQGNEVMLKRNKQYEDYIKKILGGKNGNDK